MVENLKPERRTASTMAAPVKVAGTLLALAALAAAPLVAAQERSGGQIVKSQCAKCHEAGTAGAPRIGDKAAWVPRLNRGVDTLVHIAIRGHGGMPPRGGEADLTDLELRAALLYMFDPAGPPKVVTKSERAAPPIAGPHRATVNGTDVYLGLVPAKRMGDFPAGSPEAKMHGGAPTGSGYFHVNVSLFDSATQTQIQGATVALDVEQVGMGRVTKTLEPMTVRGGASYGGYVRLLPKGSYVFIVHATKPGGAKAIEAKFQERMN